MRRHPANGERFALSLQAWLGEWIHAIGQHHERYDGSGYPNGLKKRDIAMGGRIVAVTDAFETMTAVRSYNRPLTPREASRELTRCAGTDFDPKVVRAFLGVSMGRLRWTIGLASWIAQLPFLGLPARASAGVVTSAAGVEAGAGSLAGTFAVALAGVATPLTSAVTASALTVNSGTPTATEAPSVRDLNDDSVDVVGTAVHNDDSVAPSDGAGGPDHVDGPGRDASQGKDGGHGPGEGAGESKAGPGAGDGPGRGAGGGKGGSGQGPGDGAGQGGGTPGGGQGDDNGQGQGNGRGP
jgi:hypothetical protein